MAYPTLRSSTFRSAPLGSSGDQGPLFRIVPMWLAGFPVARRSRRNLQSVVKPTPPSPPHPPPSRRHPLRLVQNHLHPHLPQLHRRLGRHPPRHHHHLGVQPPPRLQQPLNHLRRVQIRQAVVEHDQRRLHPPDLEQRVHPRQIGRASCRERV